MHKPPDNQGIPFQHVDRFRKESKNYGYVEPDVTQDRVRMHGQDTARGVGNILREVIGSRGVRDILEEYPTFFRDIEASCTEAYLDGHNTAWSNGLIGKSNENMAATGRMISAMLQPIPETDSKHLYAVRILAAHAGVPIEDVPNV